MKKLIIALISVCMLGSCTLPIVKTPYVNAVTIFDYSKYTEKGFFFTESNSVSFDYKPIGSVYAYGETGYNIIDRETKTKKFDDDVIGTKWNTTKDKLVFGDQLIVVDKAKLIDDVYNKAVEKGANAIMNLKIIETATSVAISGMAIKK